MGGILILLFIVLGAIWLLLRQKRHNQPTTFQLPANTAELLEKHVKFYKKLNADQRAVFEKRLAGFLSYVRVTGIKTQVTDLDRLLVASSAIIPIAAFPDWQYRNISEVLLYPGFFNKNYQLDGDDRNVMGMVGNGGMTGQMILSQQALRDGFLRNDGHNTGIHEFVHLIDMADGATDGIPEYLLSQPYIIPWVKQMHQEIRKMREGDDRDINPYAATNDQEFFAVLAEYFFERPEELEKRHPVLFRLLEKMFSGK